MSELAKQISIHDLDQTGYLFFPQCQCTDTTIEVAQSIGMVLDISERLPQSGIPNVQSLTPRNESDAERFGYSKSFGLGRFPMHTDLAHWLRPPRYLMLRCITGSEDVETVLLPVSAIKSKVNKNTLSKAVFRPRQPGKSGTLLPLRLEFASSSATGFRWDSIFLLAMNQAAHQVSNSIRVLQLDDTLTVTVTLTHPGDTLIIDNWQTLHGRAAVESADLDRHIERVYLEHLHQ